MSSVGLQIALKMLDNGEGRQAADIARGLIRQSPNDPLGHYIAGRAALLTGRHGDAVKSFTKALALGPDDIALRVSVGRAHAALRQDAEAVPHFIKALELGLNDPNVLAEFGSILIRLGNHAEAEQALTHAFNMGIRDWRVLNDLGALRRDLGRPADAIAAFEAALALAPNDPRPRANLGVAYQDLGDLPRAIECFRAALANDPGAFQPSINFAHALNKSGDRSVAIEMFQDLSERFPDLAEPKLALGMAELERGGDSAAVAAFEAAIKAEPVNPKGPYCLGEAHRRAGRADAAAAAYRQALALDPSDVCGAALGLGLIGAEPTPAAPPLGFVRELFDGYAARFDTALVDGLSYQAPELLRDAVERVGWPPAPPAGLDIIDLGCGTGLAGVAFQDRVGTLIGVDLSPRMLEQARARQLYTLLARGDVATFLNGALPRSADLLLAADVLVYLGDLGPVMAGAARVLRPGGVFAFTVEARTDSDDGYALGETHRYTHGQKTIEAIGGEDFSLALCKSAVTREDAGLPVDGLVVVLRRR